MGKAIQALRRLQSTEWLYFRSGVDWNRGLARFDE